MFFDGLHWPFRLLRRVQPRRYIGQVPGASLAQQFGFIYGPFAFKSFIPYSSLEPALGCFAGCKYWQLILLLDGHLVRMGTLNTITERAAIARYQYNPLPDADAYIRLMQVSEDVNHQQSERVDLSIWPLKTAPICHAVSYTWADEDHVGTIFVGRKPMIITGELHRRPAPTLIFQDQSVLLG